VPRNRQEVQSESDFMLAPTSPSGFTVPDNFQFHSLVVLLSDITVVVTCGFTFGQYRNVCFR